MKKLLTILSLLVCLNNGQAYKLRLNQPTLETSCQSCDSRVVVDWGDGTKRFVTSVWGEGYDPKALIRVTWLRADGVTFAFDFSPDLDGSWFCIWTDLPTGSYTVSASQPVSRFKFQDVASVAVQIY